MRRIRRAPPRRRGSCCRSEERRDRRRRDRPICLPSTLNVLDEFGLHFRQVGLAEITASGRAADRRTAGGRGFRRDQDVRSVIGGQPGGRRVWPPPCCRRSSDFGLDRSGCASLNALTTASSAGDLLRVLAGAESNEPLELDCLTGWSGAALPAPRLAAAGALAGACVVAALLHAAATIPNATRAAATRRRGPSICTTNSSLSTLPREMKPTAPKRAQPHLSAASPPRA